MVSKAAALLERESNIGTQAVPAVNKEINKAWFFAVLSLAVFGTLNAVQIVPPLVVEIARDMDVSVAVAAQLATATFAAWGVSIVTVGPLSDSFGRRPIALIGLLVLTISILAAPFAPNFETLLVLRVLTGLGGGTIPPNVIGVISDVISPERRAQAVSALLAIGMASAISVSFVALLAEWGGWRFAFMVSGLLMAAGFLANLVWFPRDSGERVRNFAILSRYRSILSLHFFQVAIAVNVTQRLAFWGMLAFFAAYLIHTYDVSVGFVALPLVISAIGQVIGTYAATYLAKTRYRALLIAATSVAGGACGFLFFAVEFQLWVAVAIGAIGMTVLSPTFPALVAASTEYSGESKATGVSFMGLTNQSGGVLGAAGAGALLAGADYAAIGYLCLGATIVTALIALVFARQLRIGEG